LFLAAALPLDACLSILRLSLAKARIANRPEKETALNCTGVDLCGLGGNFFATKRAKKCRNGRKNLELGHGPGVGEQKLSLP
jgi:hypothetical protein